MRKVISSILWSTDFDKFLTNKQNEIPERLKIRANKRIIKPEEFEFAGSAGL